MAEQAFIDDAKNEPRNQDQLLTIFIDGLADVRIRKSLNDALAHAIYEHQLLYEIDTRTVTDKVHVSHMVTLTRLSIGIPHLKGHGCLMLGLLPHLDAPAKITGKDIHTKIFTLTTRIRCISLGSHMHDMPGRIFTTIHHIGV